MRRMFHRRSPASRGSVIVLVLVTLVFAALLLTRLIETGSSDLLVAMRRADRARLHDDAHAALETVLGVLMDFRTVDGGLNTPAQGWADPLAYAGYQPRAGVRCEVSFEDESGKLSLPRLTPDTLAALFTQLGLAPADATRVADAMAVWTRSGFLPPDSSYGAAAYARGELPATPPLRSLRSFDELQNILVARDFFYDRDGRPTPLFASFQECVSLYRFGTTNLNSAPDRVLLAEGWDTSQAGAMRTYLATAGSTPHYFRSVAEARRQAGNPAMRGFGVQVQLLRINVVAYQGAARVKLSALVTWSGQATLPPPVTADGGTAANQQTAATRARGATPVTEATGILHYPFTVLELVETSLPDSPSQPDVPSA